MKTVEQLFVEGKKCHCGCDRILIRREDYAPGVHLQIHCRTSEGFLVSLFHPTGLQAFGMNLVNTEPVWESFEEAK